MSSNPSQAHFEAVNAVEDHAQKVMDAEIKRLIERPEVFMQEGNNYQSNMIDAISQKVKGRVQMGKLIGKAQEREKLQGVPNLINLAERSENSQMTELVNNLPNYKDSSIWQEMIRKKARQPEVVA